jgi:hypothetical protein
MQSVVVSTTATTFFSSKEGFAKVLKRMPLTLDYSQLLSARDNYALGKGRGATCGFGTAIYPLPMGWQGV